MNSTLYYNLCFSGVTKLMLLAHKCTSAMTIQSFAIIFPFISNVIWVVVCSLFIVVLPSHQWCHFTVVFSFCVFVCIWWTPWLSFCVSVFKQACRDMKWRSPVRCRVSLPVSREWSEPLGVSELHRESRLGVHQRQQQSAQYQPCGTVHPWF